MLGIAPPLIAETEPDRCAKASPLYLGTRSYMPHLTIEYTNNLPHFNARSTLIELNKVLVASNQFEEIDIKSRAIRLDTYVIGTALDTRAFVHAKLAILSGRSSETKRELSENMLLMLKQICEWPANINVQLCVEIQEIERESYTKAMVETVEKY